MYNMGYHFFCYVGIFIQWHLKKNLSFEYLTIYVNLLYYVDCMFVYTNIQGVSKILHF